MFPWVSPVPTATEGPQRRHIVVGALASALGLSAWAVDARVFDARALDAEDPPAAWPRLLAAWQQGAEECIGLIDLGGSRLKAGAKLVVPTRAHGLLAEPGGSVLAVARRPGDWLLRWHPTTGQTQWRWVEEDRRFNGHAFAQGDGPLLWTTETELDTAQGLLGVRNASSLGKQGEWPTHGMDPHQLLALPLALGRWPAGTLMVANGGIATLPETGRAKHQTITMDASLVALHPDTGARLGQWRLPDPFLSIRHLAWNARSQRLGIALQAEHQDADARAAAPVLAVWDGETLIASRQQPAMAGYGGDICAHEQGGFVVSCPRADALAVFSHDAVFAQVVRHPLAYALAAESGTALPLGHAAWCCSGRDAVLVMKGASSRCVAHPRQGAHAWHFDNHWVLTDAQSSHL